jgi:hypothetical protein
MTNPKFEELLDHCIRQAERHAQAGGFISRDIFDAARLALVAYFEERMKRLLLIQEATQDTNLSDGAMRHVAAMYSDLKWPYPLTEDEKQWAEQRIKEFKEVTR